MAAGNAGYSAGGDDRGGHLSSTLTFPQSASVLGYCLLPLVLTSLLGIAMPLDSVVGYAVTSLAICWSTLSSSAMFCGEFDFICLFLPLGAFSCAVPVGRLS